MKIIRVEVSEELHASIKALAALKHLSIKALMVKAIHEKVRQEGLPLPFEEDA